MFPRQTFWLFILITIFLPPAFVFSGEIYRWTDERGTAHFTDDVSNIPEKDFERVETIDAPEEITRETERTEEVEDKPDRVKEYLERIDSKIEGKKRLEKRISELEEELRMSEQRLRKIEEYEKENFQYYLPFIDKRTGKLVPMASPYYGEKKALGKRIESTKTELKALRERISEMLRGL